MVAAAGSGELLFTPRVAAQYGYTLLWALLAAVALKWFINREVGRYAVCTGASIIDGFGRLPGPRSWAVWVILVPQLVVAADSVAGLAGSAATALILLFPGGMRLWTGITLTVAAALVVWGQYNRVEFVTRLIAVTLALVSVTAAVSVLPRVETLAGGLVPQLPDQVDYGEVLPWLGYALSGAAGLMWYS
jgi:Mn2+/Fe2+ NRAMP family transporter